MTPDVPEFHTQPSTPVSPIPYHPPVPSKLPVLERQIDPIFNMTSTHTDAGADKALAPNPTSDHPENDSGSISDSNSFSDPFEDQDEPQAQPAPVTSLQTTVDADHDYAMTFDSEGEADAGDTLPQKALESPVLESSTKRSDPVIPDETPPPAISTPAAQARITSTIHAQPHSTEATAAPTTTRAAVPTQGYKPSTPPPIYQSIQNGEIDIQQLLDNITANAELEAAKAVPNTASASSPTFPPGSSAVSHTSLPPRPQALSKPPMHPAYAAQNDTRAYHAGPTYPAPPGTAARAPGMPGLLIAAGAPGTHTDPINGLPPPPAASFSPPASFSRPGENMPFAPQRGPQHARGPSSIGDVEDEGEIQWGPDLQKLYEAFLAEERRNVAEGVWDKYPPGSRLFIGNLVSEKVTKKDLFYVFHKYGRLAQLSIKQAFGFVQYHDVASCSAALHSEQGQLLRGRRMHLEISKQQKNAKHAGVNPNPQNQQNQQRRSKSPDRSRGGNQRGQNNRIQQQNQSINYDRFDHRNDSRFDSHGPPPQREQDYRQGPSRGRDDYRSMRSPTPPRGGYRGREDYPPQRSGRDYYDGPNNRRTRSRSPDRNRRQSDRYRQRGPSPRRPIDEDAALQIPRRAPGAVPDVQVIIMEELDRNFISWVEEEIRKRGLKVEILFLSPRLPLEVVVKRQILEGVMAVVKLTRRTQDASKIPLQVFDRSRGADNVRYDDYENLDPNIAAEVVLREKAKVAAALQPQKPPQKPAYGQPPMQYGAQPQTQYQQQPAAAPAPNLGNVVAQLDNATLQKLLGSLSAPIPQQSLAPAPIPQQQPAPAQTNGQVDINSILSMLGQVQQQQSSQHAPQQQPQYAPQPQQHQPQQAQNQQYGAQQLQPGPQDVQNIMAQLARFRQ